MRPSVARVCRFAASIAAVFASSSTIYPFAPTSSISMSIHTIIFIIMIKDFTCVSMSRHFSDSQRMIFFAASRTYCVSIRCP